jgi:hypothetical protein
VTITGSGFGSKQGNGFVQLGTLNATAISSWSETQIVATVPSGSRCGAVAVGQNGKSTNSLPFTMSTPTITSISAISILPGMQMTITECGFGATQNGMVAIANTIGIVVKWSETQIVVTVPEGISRGQIYVQQNDLQSNFGIGPGSKLHLVFSIRYYVKTIISYLTIDKINPPSERRSANSLFRNILRISPYSSEILVVA